MYNVNELPIKIIAGFWGMEQNNLKINLDD